MINYGIIVANEYKELANLLQYLETHNINKDDIIVVVDGQNNIEGTGKPCPEVVKILNDNQIKYYIYNMNCDLAFLRNKLREHCQHDYILYLDADEIPPKKLLNYLPELIKESPNIDCFHIPRLNTLDIDIDEITNEEIDKLQLGWPPDERGRIAWPDYQEHFLKKHVKWKEPLHAIPDSIGLVHGMLPEDPSLAIIHRKTLSGQIKRKQFMDYKIKYLKDHNDTLTDSYGITYTTINSRGCWVNQKFAQDHHLCDTKLRDILTTLFKNNTVVDFGCGDGSYVQHFIQNGISVEGYDGNPYTPQLSNNTCKVLDLSIPFVLQKQFDWVLSLEVGEHIPPQYEDIFIDNLCRHSTKGIILSWGIPNQGGEGHINEKPNNYIINKFLQRDYLIDIFLSNLLRYNIEQAPWFQNTLMVFRKVKTNIQIQMNLL